ncbi:MAG TPA: sulfate transporter subunit, partial [Planctomicrobium sp.]|nr:sulfate transporter subunit [Planctomicrobium sp.]
IHEPHIAIVDANVDRRGIREHAEAYLDFLYTLEGQEIIARHHFRPSDPDVLEKHLKDFPPLKMFTIQDLATDWDDAHRQFFSEGGVFDKIYSQLKR